MHYGSGSVRYELCPDWAQVPDGWSFIDIGGIAIDEDDNVYVLNRSELPVMVFDCTGRNLGLLAAAGLGALGILGVMFRLVGMEVLSVFRKKEARE